MNYSIDIKALRAKPITPILYNRTKKNKISKTRIDIAVATGLKTGFFN
jgi:uncharacterized phage-associated protein